jgi:hypothetical protein
MHNAYNNEPQQLLDRNMRGFGLAGILFLIILTYSPVLFTSFVIDTELLHHRKPSLHQLGEVMIISGGIYLVIFFAKGFMLYCKGRGYRLWWVIFTGCVAYTSVPPAIASFYILHYLMATVFAGSIALVFGYIVYCQYHFLSDTNAGLATPFYRMGIDLAHRMYRTIEKRRRAR